MKKELYGRLNIGWGGNILLPLEEAHKIQSILAKHAHGFGAVYNPNNRSLTYVTDYTVPDVSAIEFPKYDACGLTAAQIQLWSDAVSNDNGDGTDVISPRDFIAIRGMDNE